MKKDLLLRGGRVIDSAQGLDGPLDVLVVDGKIGAVGPSLAPPPDAEVLDVAGKIVSPGFFDMHVHVYGGLAFADPDSVGVNLGSTSVADAGGAGAYSWDEFKALIVEQARTDVYLYLSLRAGGIFGSYRSFFDIGDVRSLIDIPVNQMLDIVDANRDVIRAVKLGGFESYGVAPMQVAKGMAKILGLPLYVHIGDLVGKPPETFTDQILDLLEAGDIVTHCFNSNPGNLLGKDGKVLPQALAAQERGVRYDIGFGSFNFSYDVAEQLLAEGILPTTISSDLQQSNVTGPVYSLTHVMSAMLPLGYSLHDALRMVTVSPAAQLGLADRIGSLRPGMPGDVTVIAVEQGDFVFDDTSGGSRRGQERIVPFVTIKDGEPIWPNRERAEAEENWSFEGAIAYDEVPAQAGRLDAEQRAFLGHLADTCRDLEDWNGVLLHETFGRTRRRAGIGLRRAAEAVLDSFMTARFTPPVGFFLGSQERDFVVARLAAVGTREAAPVHPR
jgi:dihydroorotase